MNWKYFSFVCASLLMTFPAFGQSVEPDKVEPAQLKVITGEHARGSLGVSVTFGDEDRVEDRVKGEAGTRGGTGNSQNSRNNPGTSSLPLWTYSVRAGNGRTYTGNVVGASPAATTIASVPVTLVPVIIKISQGGVTYTFDPTQPDSGCLPSGTAFALTESSPLFAAASFSINSQSVGPTTYGDAFLQAEFYNSAGSAHSQRLSLPTSTGSALTISVNAGTRGNSTAEVYGLSGTQCGTNPTTNPGAKLAVVNLNTIDAALQSYIKSHSLNASEFPFFVTYNTVMSEGSASNVNNCCVIGYHNALGNPGQTYGVAEFEGRDQTVFSGFADVAAASHEVNEWINDPAGNNATPSWGNVGQVSGCQANFEVGDPLTGNLMPAISLGGFNYHLQELTFFSWFFGGTSLGTGGEYSSNGTFKGPSKACPPGGTN